MGDRKERICAARELIRKGVKNVIVTLGGEGCIHVTADSEEFFSAHKVKAVLLHWHSAREKTAERQFPLDRKHLP